MKESEALNLFTGQRVEFLPLQFAGILGSIKNVEIPSGRLYLQPNLSPTNSPADQFPQKEMSAAASDPDYTPVQ